MLNNTLRPNKECHGKNEKEDRPIGSASANSVEFRGIRPRMYIEDLL